MALGHHFDRPPTFRDALRDLLNPILDSLKEMTDEPAVQSKAMREMASACSPASNRMALIRLSEKMEDLIDGRITGNLTHALEADINRLSDTLDALRKSSNDYAGFLEPYGGVGGLVRLVMETGTQPWNFLTGIAGKHPFQIRRRELEAPFDTALEEFFDAFQSLVLAFESMLSRHTGKHFSFRGAYEHTVRDSKPEA